MYSQPYVIDRYYTGYMGVWQILAIWDSSWKRRYPGVYPHHRWHSTLAVSEPRSWQSSFRPCHRPLPGSAGEKLCFAGSGSLMPCKTIDSNHHGSSGKILTCLPWKLALKWELLPDTPCKAKNKEPTTLGMPTQRVCFGDGDWSLWLERHLPLF